MNTAQNTAVVIPAYKPDERLPAYVRELAAAGIGQIVVVDDGSGDACDRIFEQTEEAGAHVIRYPVNGGKGVALRCGLTYVKDECKQARFIVTADSDGQHTVQDVLRMCEALGENEEGLLLGSRDFSGEDVPFKSRAGNRITTTVFWLLYGRKVPDTQTGLRGFARKLLPAMVSVKGDRYEYEMNVLIECAQLKLPIRALPIETVYENNNEGSHFRAVQDSARIYAVILAGFFKFISSSLIGFLVDILLFTLISSQLAEHFPEMGTQFRILIFSFVPHIAVATCVARIASGLANFILNKKVVFHSHGTVKQTLPRYLCVFFLIMLLSMGLTGTVHLWLNISETAAKIPVDILLFLLSYYLQRKWVFPKELPTE